MKSFNQNIKFIFQQLVVFAFVLFVLLLSSCSEERIHPANFYYWKTEKSLNKSEVEIFKNLKSKKLYVRLFDLDITNGIPKPQAILTQFDNEKLQTEYVPVIFITNRVFTNASDESLSILAKKVFEMTEKLMDDNFGSFKELQIDCDWTESTKTKYFAFLQKLKKISNKNITCTLRLHQVKYKEKAGVPPVIKTYLMAYATSNPLGEEDINSILDLSLLKNYLETINEYPLDFDVALPLYSWAIVTNHLGRKKLINGITEADLENKNFKIISPGIYEVLENVFLRGVYLNKGFKLKLETISPELLSKEKKFLDQKINKPYNIVYYHLDSLFTNRFTLKNLK